MKIEQPDKNVTVIRFDDVKAGWEQWVMLRSDTHHDSVFCDVELEKQHLELAKQRNAIILDAGDLFDAMQGREDKRRLQSELKVHKKKSKDEEEYVDDYFDWLVQDNADFYAPYASLFAVMGMGNHETAVLKHMQTNLTKRLVSALRNNGSQVRASGYNGWVRFQFKVNRTKNKSFTLYYDHGKGGSSPVTRGVITTNRMAVYLPEADIVLTGHTHDAFYVPIRRIKLTSNGNVATVVQHHIKTPTYKDSWSANPEYGFDIEKGSPKPVGCFWIRFYFHSEKIVDFDVIPDIS